MSKANYSGWNIGWKVDGWSFVSIANLLSVSSEGASYVPSSITEAEVYTSSGWKSIAVNVVHRRGGLLIIEFTVDSATNALLQNGSCYLCRYNAVFDVS